MTPTRTPAISKQYCRLIKEYVHVTVRPVPKGGMDSYEGGAREKALVCLDKRDECFKLSCHFTTDGGEWPFHITLEELSQSFIHGAGI